MARQREDLTRKAAEQGIDVAPGQLEAAGLAVADPPAEAPARRQPLTAEECGTYFRVKIINNVVNDPGAHNHVVRAPDAANAWEVFCQEMGVIGVDMTVNRREISPATEREYVLAQARRFGVSVRDQSRDGFLTWQPPGGIRGKYKVSPKGELSEAE